MVLGYRGRSTSVRTHLFGLVLQPVPLRARELARRPRREVVLPPELPVLLGHRAVPELGLALLVVRGAGLAVDLPESHHRPEPAAEEPLAEVRPLGVGARRERSWTASFFAINHL